MPRGKTGSPDRPVWPVSTFISHTGAAYAVAITPDGAWLVTASCDKTARLWAANGTPGDILENGTPVTAVAIAPDAAWLVTATRDGTAQLWAANPPASL